MKTVVERINVNQIIKDIISCGINWEDCTDEYITEIIDSQVLKYSDFESEMFFPIEFYKDEVYAEIVDGFKAGIAEVLFEMLNKNIEDVKNVDWNNFYEYFLGEFITEKNGKKFVQIASDYIEGFIHGVMYCRGQVTGLEQQQQNVTFLHLPLHI